MTDEDEPLTEGAAAEAAAHDIPMPEHLRTAIAQDWDPAPPMPHAARADGAPFTAARRAALSAQFPGRTIVVPAGRLKARANDTDYAFRAATAFTWLTGETEAEAVLVMTPDGGTHRSTLYVQVFAQPGEVQYFTGRTHGAVWVGNVPSPAATQEPCSASRPGRWRRSRTTWHAHPRDALVPARRRQPRRRRCWRAATAPNWRGCSTNCGWSRTTGRSPGCARLRGDRARIRRRGEGNPARARTARSAASAGWKARSGAGPGWRATRSATARSSAPARTARRCTGGATTARSRAVSCCWPTWASRPTSSTPPTSPARCRSTGVDRRPAQGLQRRSRGQAAGIGEVKAGADFLGRAPRGDVGARRTPAQLGDPAGHGRRGCDQDTERPGAGLHRRYTLHGTSHMLGIDVHDCALARDELYKDGPLAAGLRADRRAGPVLPGQRPHGAGGAARPRRPDRGRHRWSPTASR